MYSCTQVHINTRTYVFTSTWIHLNNGIIQNDDKMKINILEKVKGREMKGVAVSQCTFPTNGHAVVSNWISGNRLRPTYSVCKIPYVASWCTFLLKDLALTSRSADINARSFRWNSSGILHGVGRSITTIFPKKYKTQKADIHYHIRFQSVFMYTSTH